MPRPIGNRRNVPGKVIDRWIYKVKDVTLDKLDYVPEEEREGDDEKYREVKERVQNKVVTVELWLEKTTKQSEEAPHPLDAIKFYLKCDELDITLEGTDVELLRAAMWTKLDAHYAIKWDKYFLVEVDSTHPYSGWGTGMIFSYGSPTPVVGTGGVAPCGARVSGKLQLCPHCSPVKEGQAKDFLLRVRARSKPARPRLETPTDRHYWRVFAGDHPCKWKMGGVSFAASIHKGALWLYGYNVRTYEAGLVIRAMLKEIKPFQLIVNSGNWAEAARDIFQAEPTVTGDAHVFDVPRQLVEGRAKAFLKSLGIDHFDFAHAELAPYCD